MSTRMRTLVDLLNDETGYVRIYADHTGYGYERSTYAPHTIGDLFDRMNGYACMATARDAARLQLKALPRPARRKPNIVRQSARRLAR
jgi:hypothetical protein